MCARSLQESVCDFYGRPAWLSCISFTGLYMPGLDDDGITDAVSVVRAHRALGVFVVPRRPSREWYKVLTEANLVRFDLPAGALSRGSLVRVGLGVDATAFVANFGWIGRLKSKRRPEKVFQLQVIPMLRKPPFRVGTIPRLMTRASPMAESMRPNCNPRVRVKLWTRASTCSMGGSTIQWYFMGQRS